MMPMMNGNGSINMMNVAINNAQDTDRMLTEQEILSAPDCIDSALKHGKRPADYCSDKSFKAFWGVSKEDMDREIKIEQKVSEEVSNRNFERTWGMSKEEMYEKNLAEVRANDKTEQALNKMATILDKTEIAQEEIGNVFEKPQYPDLKEGLTKVKGIDQNVLDNLKNQVDMLDNSKKEAELKNRDEATMSGPKGYGSSLDMLK